jgi:hypothetical protein
VRFPAEVRHLLGGIGQATSKVPGFEPGHNFYLLVDDLNATINRALEVGGMRYVEPMVVDGYRFAMVRDPEWSPVGLVEPFDELGMPSQVYATPRFAGPLLYSRGRTKMGYLNTLRLHFAGQFQFNISMVNNAPAHFR